MVSGNGDTVRNLADHVKFLNRDLIDFVQQVDARHVGSVAFDNVD